MRIHNGSCRPSLPAAGLAAAGCLVLAPGVAQASPFSGAALDKIADVMTWVVLIVAPVIAITVFWLVHILPEKIAEKRGHPQAKAIQCLCLLSLAFGGLLWPLAWLWTYTKPVLHKMAYGTDREDHETPEARVERLRRELAQAEQVAGSAGPAAPAEGEG